MGDTPRTNKFVADMQPLVLRLEDFQSKGAAIRVDREIRDLMIRWAQFARELERELNAAPPPADESELYPRAPEPPL